MGPNPSRNPFLRYKLRDAAKDGRFERFKTSTEHDGNQKHPEWLERASI